jgi:hypothetical protein
MKDNKMYKIPTWVNDLDELAEAWGLNHYEFNAIKGIYGASRIRQGLGGRHKASDENALRDFDKAIHYTGKMRDSFVRSNATEVSDSNDTLDIVMEHLRKATALRKDLLLPIVRYIADTSNKVVDVGITLQVVTLWLAGRVEHLDLHAVTVINKQSKTNTAHLEPRQIQYLGNMFQHLVNNIMNNELVERVNVVEGDVYTTWKPIVAQRTIDETKA